MTRKILAIITVISISILLILAMMFSNVYAQDDINLDTISDFTSDANIQEVHLTLTENSQETQVSDNAASDASLAGDEVFEHDDKTVFLNKIFKKAGQEYYYKGELELTRDEFVGFSRIAADYITDWKNFYRNIYTRMWSYGNRYEEPEISKTDKDKIADGLINIYDYVSQNGTQIDVNEYASGKDNDTGTTDYHMWLQTDKVGRTTETDEEVADVIIKLYNNYCELNIIYWNKSFNGFFKGVKLFDYYYIENPKEFMDYVLSMGDVFGIETNDEIEYNVRKIEFDYEAQTYDGEPYKVVDRVSFEADIDDSFYDTFIEEVASPNSTISCVIELIRSGTTNYLLFNIKGDRGEKLYWDVPYYRWESNWIMFYANTYCYGNHFASTNEPMFYIKVEGVTEEDGKIDLTLTVNLGQIGDLPTKIVSKNLTYESFIDEDTSIWDKNRNLGGLFSLTREKMAEENEKIKEQLSQEIDYENYVNYLRKKDENGNVIFDYYVHFVAQVELSINSNILPDWYNKLGDNVTATVIGLTRTIRNTQRADSMILFKGDDGEKWFTNSSIIPSSAMTMMKYTSDEELSINCTYSELKSFDGEKTVRNTVEYEQMSFKFNYKNDGYLTPDGIDFKIGTKSQHFDEKDINYIGGGKLSYANLS